jgi:hypothetical protein
MRDFLRKKAFIHPNKRLFRRAAGAYASPHGHCSVTVT